MNAHSFRLDAGRLAAIGFLALVAAAAACADRDDATPRRDDAIVTAPGGISAATVRASDDVRQKNRFSHVGDAHNRLLDEFRAELRKPGVLTGDICEYVMDFTTKDNRESSAFAVPTQQRRSLAATGAKASRICASGLVAREIRPTSLRRIPQEATSAATALAGQIESAVEFAVDRYDLAARISPILDAAAMLSEVDNAVVSATASVAQSSYEYWEANYSGFEQEFIADYGPCATDRINSGYTEEDARASCVGGAETYQSFWSWPTSPSLQGGLVRRLRVPRCGPGLKEGFKHIAKSDAKGAFSGAFSAAIVGGPAGVLGGAVLGAGSGSIWAGIENAWSTFWCMQR